MNEWQRPGLTERIIEIVGAGGRVVRIAVFELEARIVERGKGWSNVSQRRS